VERDFEASLELELTDWLDLEAFYTSDPASTYGDIGVDLDFHHQWGLGRARRRGRPGP
jgi:hypothetical protein